MRLTLAVLAGKSIKFLSRCLKLGAGSNYPGYIAHRIDPRILAKLARDTCKIVITGTNGKTTTSGMLAHILRIQNPNTKLMHNNLGANLIGGLTTSLLEGSSIRGHTEAEYSILETDEATVPVVIEDLAPQVVVVTNLFRDQLDRFGEIRSIYSAFHGSFKNLPRDSTLVLNADDPLVADLGRGLDLETIYYSLEGPDADAATTMHTLQGEDPHGAPEEPRDIVNCIHCGTPYNFQAQYLAHLGHYRCPECGHEKPAAAVYSENIELNPDLLTFELHISGSKCSISLKLPALYNVYNLLAAAGAASAAGITPDTIAEGLRTFRPVFGRMEEIQLDRGQRIFIVLVKNPAGFNEVLRTLTSSPCKKRLLILINDMQADGEDVSWLWDVNFELLHRLSTAEIVVSGLRGEEIAVRLKYAGIDSIKHIEDPGGAFIHSLSALEDNETLHVLPTYSALIGLRQFMEERGLIASAWGEEQK